MVYGILEIHNLHERIESFEKPSSKDLKPCLTLCFPSPIVCETQFILWKSQKDPLGTPHVGKYLNRPSCSVHSGILSVFTEFSPGTSQAICPYSFVQIKVFYYKKLYSIIHKFLSLEERLL